MEKEDSRPPVHCSPPLKVSKLYRATSGPWNPSFEDLTPELKPSSLPDDTDLIVGQRRNELMPLRTRDGLNPFTSVEEEPQERGLQTSEIQKAKVDIKSTDSVADDLQNLTISFKKGIKKGYGPSDRVLNSPPAAKTSESLLPLRTLRIDPRRSSRSPHGRKIPAAPRSAPRVPHGSLTDFLFRPPNSDSWLGDKKWRRHPHYSKGLARSLNLTFVAMKERVNQELRIFVNEVRLRLGENEPLDDSVDASFHRGRTYSLDRKLWNGPETAVNPFSPIIPESDPAWIEGAKRLQELALSCEQMAAEDFAYVAEDIVKDLNVAHSQLKPGRLKELHTNLLFTLTRCTRILLVHKETQAGFPVQHSVASVRPSVAPPSPLRNRYTTPQSVHWWARSGKQDGKDSRTPADWRDRDPESPSSASPSSTATLPTVQERVQDEFPVLNTLKTGSRVQYPANAGAGQAALLAKKLAAWGKTSPVRPKRKTSRLAGNSEPKAVADAEEKKRGKSRRSRGSSSAPKGEHGSQASFRPTALEKRLSFHEEDLAAAMAVDTWAIDEDDVDSGEAVELKAEKNSPEGRYAPQGFAEEQQMSMVLCRICEEDVEINKLEEHSKYCEVADEGDAEGLTINQRLASLADAIRRVVQQQQQQDCKQRQVDDRLDSVPGFTGGRALDLAVSRSSSGRMDRDCPSPLSGATRGARESSEAVGRPRAVKVAWAMESDAVRRTASAGSSGNSSPATMVSNMCSSLVSSYFSDTPSSPSPKFLVEEGGGRREEVEGQGMEEWQMLSEVGYVALEGAGVTRNGDNSEERLGALILSLKKLMAKYRGVASVLVFGCRIDTLLRDKLRLLNVVTDGASIGALSDDGEFDEDATVAGRSGRNTPLHPLFAQRQLSIDDFHILKRISKGAYGRVFLAKKKTTGDLFAIKVLRKADMLRKNAVESVQAERNILVSTNSPFVVRFFFSFTCENNLYLVMEYLNGGDMFSLLHNMGCLEEQVAQRYIAELVLALEYVHSLGIVHRDLKPDNLLISCDGHIKLTDFGLSKIGLVNSTGDFPVQNGLSEPSSPNTHQQSPSFVSSPGSTPFRDSSTTHKALFTPSHFRSQSVPNSPISRLGHISPLPQWQPDDSSGMLSGAKHTALGTPDYLAPEMLLGTEHGPAADWWSVGVILFEFLTGRPPFNAGTPQDIFDNILSRQIPWPSTLDDMSPDARDLIERLLTPDPKERLGYRGSDEVKQHPFFRDVKWDSLAWDKAAFVPAPDDPTDTSYFTTRHIWTPEDERDDSECESEATDSTTQRDKVYDLPEVAPVDQEVAARNLFSNFTYKNLPQLASMNHNIAGCSARCSPSHEFSSPGMSSPNRCHSVFSSPRREFHPSPVRHRSHHTSPSRY